ncbi:hypothetical protein BV25DRAFT_1920833 [Artomyces pyxidatus]|uniref:Uncharacterized protein n=1 Tax=Artomyces pyxidatus TaxID=48021 RepID=A0ACB8SJZ5_9AGAM|nr:hypothetical protein BV25DRAFT_1920833 [Artomyces pyxidatus]
MPPRVDGTSPALQYLPLHLLLRAFSSPWTRTLMISTARRRAARGAQRAPSGLRGLYGYAYVYAEPEPGEHLAFIIQFNADARCYTPGRLCAFIWEVLATPGSMFFPSNPEAEYRRLEKELELRAGAIPILIVDRGGHYPFNACTTRLSVDPAGGPLCVDWSTALNRIVDSYLAAPAIQTSITLPSDAAGEHERSAGFLDFDTVYMSHNVDATMIPCAHDGAMNACLVSLRRGHCKQTLGLWDKHTKLVVESMAVRTLDLNIEHRAHFRLITWYHRG